MSTISITDLNPTGADLFADSESYLQHLSSDEELGVVGGTWFTSTIPCTISISIVTYLVTREVTKQIQPE
ncbi:MAG: hypothetical protein KME17_11605 [Cyanosarcina radialis HA8281-LM2]|jgi:hypothetical protein|nr:hypothetical protein [Cyanosarcina radialis HA8281-LM2]